MLIEPWAETVDLRQLTEGAKALDSADPLAYARALFVLPEGVTYLDGNSLGAMPKSVMPRVQEVLEQQWAEDLIASWNRHGWIDLPLRVGERIAPLIGAAQGQTLCVDSISVNLFKLLATAIQLQDSRSVILIAEGDFPTDGYVAAGLALLLAERCEIRRVPIAQLPSVLDDSVAVVMLTEVNYRTGERYPMAELTELAHDAGALMLWDLAHSAGVMPIHLDDCNVDMAVGCGYKFLNGGPGAPGFLYLNKRLHNRVQQPLAGWLGHAKPFAFDARYSPAAGVARYLAGTPPIISMQALDAALDVFDRVSVHAIRQKSVDLSRFLLEALQGLDVLETLRCLTPGTESARGSQISLQHADAWGMSQALIERGVIVDFRAPDILRIGIAPLYNSFADMHRCAQALRDVLVSKAYDDPKYAVKLTVT
ncbi:MAG: kynureninase [Congregibacter sp.]